MAVQLALGQLSQEAFDMARSQLEAKRRRIQEDKGRLVAKLRSLKELAITAEKVSYVRETMAGRLNIASPEDKRWVLEMLGTRVLMWKDRVEVEIAVPKAVPDAQGVFVSFSPGPPATLRRESAPGPAHPATSRTRNFCPETERRPPGPAKRPFRLPMPDGGTPAASGPARGGSREGLSVHLLHAVTGPEI